MAPSADCRVTPRLDDRGTGDGPGGELSLALHKKVVDSLSDGVYYVDSNRRITYWNQGAEAITGYPAAAVLGRPCFEDRLCHVDAAGQSQCGTCPMSTAISRGWERHQVLWLRHAAGHRVPVRVRSFPIRDTSGRRIIGAVETFSDASSSPEVEESSRAAAAWADPFLDAVTALPDRRVLGIVLAARRDDLDRHWLPFGLILADVDNVSRLAAEFGPGVAGQAIRSVADILRGTLRAGDTIVRWSPTEFAVLISTTEIEGLDRVTDRMLRLVRGKPAVTTAGLVPVRISIGATIGSRGEAIEMLYQRAEMALTTARARGHDCVVLVDPTRPGGHARLIGTRSR